MMKVIIIHLPCPVQAAQWLQQHNPGTAQGRHDNNTGDVLVQRAILLIQMPLSAYAASGYARLLHVPWALMPQPLQEQLIEGWAWARRQPWAVEIHDSWQQLAHAADAHLAGCPPHQLVLWTAAVILALCLVVYTTHSWWLAIQEDGGLLQALFEVIRSLPGISGYVQKEQSKMRTNLLAQRSHSPSPPLCGLPASSMPAAQVLQQLKQRRQSDLLVADGNSKASGCVYMGSASHRKLMDDAFTTYSTTNPLHADQFPSVRQLEAEVVAMTAGLLGGGPGTSVCGCMTSGGSESILLAMKAARDWARARRGVRRPELVIAESAHAAYFKAAEYFKMKLVVLPVGKDMRLSGRAVRAALTGNTAVVVASAPCFPHGVVDHIQDIAKVCRRRGVCLHVDACLGGFVLAFANAVGRNIPAWDFSVKGVTSISIDTHKFGLAHKGTSVLLYADPQLRAQQYTSITTWTGGLYISPTMAGSRPGGLIACAWAAMLSLGEEGYREQTRRLFELSDRFQAGVADIPGIELVAVPDMCLVAIKAASTATPQLNMYQLKDLLSQRGWHLNALQSPPALHFCFTPAHLEGGRDVASALLADLKVAVHQLQQDPTCVQGGSAPLYGMANVVPDKRLVGDFLRVYQDVMLEP